MANQSTGPRSAEGKARSSMNALKSGIYSKSEIIHGEDRADLDALTAEFYQRYQPTRPEQRVLIDTLIRCAWNLRRLSAAESQLWEYKIEFANQGAIPTNFPMGLAVTCCNEDLARLHRMVNAIQRNFRDALHEIERLNQLPDPEPDPTFGAATRGSGLSPDCPEPTSTPGPILVADPTPHSESPLRPQPLEAPSIASAAKVDETNSPAGERIGVATAGSGSPAARPQPAVSKPPAPSPTHESARISAENNISPFVLSTVEPPPLPLYNLKS